MAASISKDLNAVRNNFGARALQFLEMRTATAASIWRT